MENLFYEPLILGFIFDIQNSLSLKRLKQAIIQLIQTLEAETENKVYVYRPKVDSLNRWLSESIYDVSNYHEQEKLDPEKAIIQTIKVISTDMWNAHKHVFYFTDQKTESRHRRVTRAMNVDTTLGTNCSFWLWEIGKVEDSLLKATENTHPKASYKLLQYQDITLDILKESIHGKNYISDSGTAESFG